MTCENPELSAQLVVLIDAQQIQAKVKELGSRPEESRQLRPPMWALRFPMSLLWGTDWIMPKGSEI